MGGHRAHGIRSDERQRWKIKPISTAEYFANAKAPVSPRPTYSALDLAKIEATGLDVPDWEESLKAYVTKELKK